MRLKLIYPCCGSAVRLTLTESVPKHRFERTCPKCQTTYDIIAKECATALSTTRIHRVTWDDTKNTDYVHTYGK